MKALEKSSVDKFLSELLSEIGGVGIDVEGLKVDHIAYSASSSDEYEKLLPGFLKNGELVQEAIITNRRVAVVKLHKAVYWDGQTIEVVELIEPVHGEKSISGWEHAEFLADDYDEILQKYPDLSWNTKHKDRDNFSRIKGQE